MFLFMKIISIVIIHTAKYFTLHKHILKLLYLNQVQQVLHHHWSSIFIHFYHFRPSPTDKCSLCKLFLAAFPWTHSSSLGL